MHAVLILLATIIKGASCGSVLFYVPFVTKSVKIGFMPLAEKMATKGHEVVVVMPYATEKPNPKIKEMIIDNQEWEEMQATVSEEKLKTGGDPMSPLIEIVAIAILLNDRALSHIDMQRHLKEGKKFDIVVVSAFLASEGGYYLAKKFDASLVIYSSPQVSLPWINSALSQPNNPSYIPNHLIKTGEVMGFKERFISFIANGIMEHVFRNYYILGKVNQLLDKHFQGEERPCLLDLERNVSAVLAFTHPLIANGFRPTNPNYVDLGMMNCRTPVKIKDDPKLKTFLDDAKDGVVYVSFGSVVKASVMGDDKRKALLNVFGKLKQKVLWKWEIDDMDDKPPNVMLRRWLPQQDVLGHPNLKLFISHGGKSSFQETVCHKKPALFIPITGDQPANSREAEKSGFGLMLPYQELTEESLGEKLNLLLNDPKYAMMAKKIGALYIDQPQHPLERATWWLEHIMRHPHAYRNKSPVSKLTWYQYFCLDVILTIALILFFVGTLIYNVILAFCSCCS